MKKGIIGLMTACMLFNLVVVSHTQKVEAADTNGAWTLVKDVNSLEAEDQIIIAAHAENYALGTTQNSNNRNAVAINKSNDTLTVNSNVQILTLKAGTKDGTFSLYTGSGYLYAASSKSNHLKTQGTNNNNGSWTISITDTGVATLKAQGTNTRNWLRFNSTNSPKIFSAYGSGQADVAIYELVESEINTECDHTFGEVENPQYKESDATCTSPAIYFKECTKCYAQGTDTFKYGDPLPHNYQHGVCVDCDGIDPTTTELDRVSSLFTTYYNEGSYTKYSVLNTSKEVIKEVAKYFHASADTKYRKTDYTPEGLKMTISDTKDGEYTNESIYKNEGGKVVHTGLGGDYTVNKPSVEDWFVTLKDFVDNPGASWTYENGVYSHDLVPATATEEDELTRMAREFVAPMWLAPNKDNFAYARFNKLTVQEANNTLVMKLYVENNDLLEENSNNVFSEVTISKGSESISALAVFELGTNGSATHNDGSEASSSLKFTEGANTLSLTGISKVWEKAIDAKGNSCLKLGTTKAVGSFQFTAPDNVNKVIINVAGYKGDTVKITVNGVSHTINTLSNNGEYTSITVDTSTTKTVNFATTSTGYRCMINSIEYHK